MLTRFRSMGQMMDTVSLIDPVAPRELDSGGVDDSEASRCAGPHTLSKAAKGAPQHRPISSATAVARSIESGYLKVVVSSGAAMLSVMSLARLVWPSEPEVADRMVGASVVLMALALFVREVFGSGTSEPQSPEQLDPDRLEPASEELAETAGPRPSKNPIAAVPTVGFALITFSSAVVTRIDGRTDLWSGFGVPVVVLALLLAAVGSRVLGARRQYGHIISAWVVWVGRLLSLVCSVYYLPSVLQSKSSLLSAYDAQYSVHETLAPLAGRIPMGNSVSQYGYLVGWPILLIRSIAQRDPMGVAITYLSGLAVVTLAILCWIASRSLAKGWGWAALLVVLPLALVKQPNNHFDNGSIAALFSALPIRTFLPMILAATLVILTRWILDGSSSAVVFVGILGGLCALNNLEFGVPALVASLATLCALTKRPIRSVALALVGAFVPFAAYEALLRSWGSGIDFNKYTFFLRAFGAGFGREAMPTFGLWLFVFATLIGGFWTGLVGARHLRTVRQLHDHREWAPVATALFFGLFGCLTVFYYSGRSVVSSQLQIFLLFVGPVALSSVSIWRSMPNAGNDTGSRTSPARLMVLFPIGLAVASLLLAPSFSYEVTRLRRSEPISVFPSEDAVVARMKRSPGDSVYFGPLGHVVSIRSGRRNALLFNHPTDATLSVPMAVAACDYVKSFGNVPLYVDRESVAALRLCVSDSTRVVIIP